MSGLFGLGGIASLLHNVNDVVNNVAETLSPGSTSAFETVGNLIGTSGVTDDVIHGLESGDLTTAVAGVYTDVIGPGGIVNNLAEGHGLGIEGLLGTALGTADGLLGGGDGLLGGVLGGLGVGDGGLLG